MTLGCQIHYVGFGTSIQRGNIWFQLTGFWYQDIVKEVDGTIRYINEMSGVLSRISIVLIRPLDNIDLDERLK